jgi:hypothetical protein
MARPSLRSVLNQLPIRSTSSQPEDNQKRRLATYLQFLMAKSLPGVFSPEEMCRRDDLAGHSTGSSSRTINHRVLA